jgi:hypothetical protein
MAVIILSVMLLLTSSTGFLGHLVGEDATRPSQAPNQVWYTLDNGLEIAVVPIVSLLPPSRQRVTIITLWETGAHNDPAGSAGRSKLAAHLIPLCKAGDRAARSYQQWQDAHGGRAEIRAGSRHCWIVEPVSPTKLLDTIVELGARFGELEIVAADMTKSRQWFDSQKRSGKQGDLDRLAGKLLDRLDPLQSGPRDRVDLDKLSIDEMRRFIDRAFKPVNTRIVIVGPFDPGPVVHAVKKRLSLLPGGKTLVKPPVPVPAPGKVNPFAAMDPDHGMVARGWRVPALGTIEALSLGFFIPRARRALQQGHGDCIWDPFLDPEVLILHQEVFGNENFQPKSIEEAISRIDATINFAISAPVEGGDYEGARKSIGIRLGAYRVHEEVSMIDPLPVAEVTLLRRIYKMKEAELQNNFGRNALRQLQQFQEKYLVQEKAVSGTIVPSGIKAEKSSTHPGQR